MAAQTLSPKQKLRRAAVKILQTTHLNKFAHHFYYRYVHPFDTANKDVLPALEKAFRTLKGTRLPDKGDYCEFGVFKGYAFWHAQETARQLKFDKMRFFGFDSFQGLPEITSGPDQTKHDEFYKGQFCCSKEQVTKNLNAKGVNWQRTHLIEGFFDHSLTPALNEKYDLRCVALALIDCDLYASTVDVLGFLRDLLMDGTILMFDDWNCFDKDNTRGQRRAFREFLEGNPHVAAVDLFPYGLYGQVFRIQTRS